MPIKAKAQIICPWLLRPFRSQTGILRCQINMKINWLKKNKLLCHQKSLKNLVQNLWNNVVCFLLCLKNWKKNLGFLEKLDDTTIYVFLLSAVAVTSLEIGNSLSYWNLDSKHSSRMKLLKKIKMQPVMKKSNLDNRKSSYMHDLI